MNRNIQALENCNFDILVVGAGMFGACVAWSAALRGYSVAIVDKSDFGGETSANHFKLIHSGIRYLQHADLARMRESSRERSALIRVAPHLCAPLPIVIPTYGLGKKGLPLMRLGMLAYDLLSCDRNRGITDPLRRTPMGRVLNRESVLEMFPGISSHNLTGAAVIHDGQIYNPARLTLSFLRGAVSKGAQALNYVTATNLLWEGSTAVGCTVVENSSGRQFAIKSRFVVNTAGPWAEDFIWKKNKIEFAAKPSFSRDLAFVVNRSISSDHALGCQAKSNDSDTLLDRGGRHLFLTPWRGKTLVGVWHRVSKSNPDELPVSREELDGYVREINEAYKNFNISIDDIELVNTGHILFGNPEDQKSSEAHSFAKRSVIIDHTEHNIDGLITVVGARATVARGVAEKVLDRVGVKLDGPQRVSDSQWLPIHGGDFDSFEVLCNAIRQDLPQIPEHNVLSLARNYGSAYIEVIACAQGHLNYLSPIGNSSVLQAEVLHAVRHEMAINLSDIVFRRTELCTAGSPGLDAIECAAKVAGEELSWSKERIVSEVEAVVATLNKRGPWNFFDTEGEMPDEIGVGL